MSLQFILQKMRSQKRISQLELACRLGVSQRHVSFVELGKTHPSRGLLCAWLAEVDAAPSLRNAALLAAGYASQENPGMASVEAEQGAWSTLRGVLEAHNPMPGFIFTSDRYIRAMNRAAKGVFGLLMPKYLREGDLDDDHFDMIAAVADPDGFLSKIDDPVAAARGIVSFLKAEVWLRKELRERVAALEAALERRYGALSSPAGAQGVCVPQLMFGFNTEEGLLNFVLTQSAVGLPQDVTVSSPRLELWFAADQATRHAMEALAAR